MVRYAKLPIQLNLSEIQNELASVNEEWQSHFNTYYFEGSWTVLALRSPDGSHTNIVPDLMEDSEYLDTVYMQHFPSVQKLLSTLNCPKMAVRFLNLKAGAIIKPHRDNELAFEKGEARLHFPIFTNPGVEFYIEDDRLPLNEGDCWYINANLTHNVFNGGSTDRIHLVVDCKVNQCLTDVINAAEQISFKDDTDRNELLKIINELRLQNTDVANKIADDLERVKNKGPEDK